MVTPMPHALAVGLCIQFHGETDSECVKNIAVAVVQQGLVTVRQ